MRILYVAQVVIDRPYGGPRHVLAVTREWAKLGHKVHLLAPGRDAPIEGVDRLRTRWQTPGARMEALLAARVRHEVIRNRPDVGYVRLSATSSFVPAAFKALGVPFVTELNGRILVELENQGRSAKVRHVVAAAQRQVAAWAFATVAVDNTIARHAREALRAQNVVTIENGADLHVAVPGDRAEARRALGLPEDRTILGFAGTLMPELRFDLLLEALPHLSGAPLLVVAGDGPARAQLENAPSALVRVMGAVPHPVAITLLQASDVCVNVRDGNIGMKGLEYAAVGRRFVSFEVEGTERLEALYPGHRAVFLVKERSPDALASALEAALLAEAQGELPPSAIEHARRQVGWDRTATRLIEVLNEAWS